MPPADCLRWLTAQQRNARRLLRSCSAGRACAFGLELDFPAARSAKHYRRRRHARADRLRRPGGAWNSFQDPSKPHQGSYKDTLDLEDRSRNSQRSVDPGRREVGRGLVARHEGLAELASISNPSILGPLIGLPLLAILWQISPRSLCSPPPLDPDSFRPFARPTRSMSHDAACDYATNTIRHAMGNTQRTTCSTQDAADNARSAPGKGPRAPPQRPDMRHASVRRTTCDMHHAPYCGMQHICTRAARCLEVCVRARARLRHAGPQWQGTSP